MTLEKLLTSVKKLHFVGIGGSGIFPMVQIFLEKGYEIQGSDNNPGDTTDQEEALGVKVMYGHDAKNIEGAEVVIYSAAIRQDNPELVAARQKGIPTFERSVVLGYITRMYPSCICVSGTHGKTTTTAILTQILIGAGLDPTAVIGGKLPLIGGSGRAGKSEIMVCEACEFADTFLQLSPDICVVLNIDADHLEYFGSLENIIKSFKKHLSSANKYIVINGEDKNSLIAAQGATVPVITFGFSSSNDYYADNIKKLSPTSCSFDLIHKGEKLETLTLNVPGRHNILNALAACVAALLAGATPNQLASELPGFKGTGRRFEILGNVRSITIADDYAHHPTELEATLKTANDMGYNEVWAVFQPFTYSRTSILLDDFAKSLSIADHVVMSEIMGGREENSYNIYTKDLADKIDGSIWFKSFEEIADYVMRNAKAGDLVITLGCGDVYKCAKMMLKK